MRTISRISVSLVALAAASSLAACGDLQKTENPLEATTTVTESATASAETQSADRIIESSEPEVAPFADESAEESGAGELPASVAESIFIRVLDDNGVIADDEKLLTGGRLACRLFDNGATPDSLSLDLLFGDIVLVEGIAPEDQATVAGAAVGALCPEHGYLLEG